MTSTALRLGTFMYPGPGPRVLWASTLTHQPRENMMFRNRKTRLVGALIGGAAAVAIVGVSATPAQAITLASFQTLSVTLKSGDNASVKACYTLNPIQADVNEDYQYIE